MNDKCTPISESSVKALVIQRLLKTRRISRGAIIASEFPLRGLGVRADLAIHGRHFLGIEIKSALDNTRRLKRQVGAYSSVFDRVIIVIASKHMAHVDASAIPGELWELTDSGRLFTVGLNRPMQCLRPSSLYKSFMTKAELRKSLCQSTKQIKDNNYRKAFLKAFDEKYRKTSESFWCEANSEIAPQALSRLSRFELGREARRHRSYAKLAQCQAWNAEITELFDLPPQSAQSSSVSYNPLGLS